MSPSFAVRPQTPVAQTPPVPQFALLTQGWPEFVPAVQTPHWPLVWQVPPVPHCAVAVQTLPGVGPSTQRGTQAAPVFGPVSQTASMKQRPAPVPDGLQLSETFPTPGFVA